MKNGQKVNTKFTKKGKLAILNEAEAKGLMEAVTNPDAPATRADIATLMWLLAQ